jgi:hypothetical protein
MTFNELHPRGAAGRFIATSHTEPGLALGGSEPVPVMDSSGEWVDVTPGQRDDAARHVYLNGQCLAMAVALSKRTGWPVLTRTVELDEGEPPLLIHAYVQGPGGVLVDYTGGRDQEAEAESWEDEDDFEETPFDLADGLLSNYEGHLGPQNTELAESFVDGVLAAYEEDWGSGPDWTAWRDGLEIPAFRRGQKFTEYTRRGTPVKVTAGIIDREARQIFTRGQCMALARVLADAKAGTPVIAFEPGTTSLAHALVRLPDSTLLDIDGVHDAADVGQSYDLVDYEPEDFAAQVDSATGFAECSDPPNYELARTFVGAVTGRAGYAGYRS